MAELGTLCGQPDVEKMAGANVSATSVAEAYTNVYIKMIEGQLCTASRYDWVTNYASVSAIGKELLRNATAAGAAALVNNYDLNQIPTGEQALQTININWALFQKALILLEKDNEYREFIKSGVGTGLD